MTQTRWYDRDGEPLHEGDRVMIWAEMFWEVGIVAFVPMNGQFMFQIVERGSTAADMEPLPGITSYRRMASCGKRLWSRRLSRVKLMERRSNRHANVQRVDGRPA